MPPQLLFDLTGIDLSRVEVSAEQVGLINPQRGAMRQLDHVILLDEATGRALGVKHVTEDEFWVPLHIPGRPMMPGVLMIEAGAQLCSIFFKFKRRTGEDRFLGFIRCDDTVFRGQVRPGDTLYLLCREVGFKPRRFVSLVQGVVDGQLIFESKITGMAFKDDGT